MSKPKYKFSPETLEYIEVKQSGKTIFKKIIFYFIASVILSIGYFSIFLRISKTPEEIRLKRENTELIQIYKDLNNKVSKIDTEFYSIENKDENIYRAIFDVKPFQIRNGGSGGSDKYLKYKDLENSKLVINTAKRIDKLSEKIKLEKKSITDLEKITYSKQDELIHTPAIQPVENKDLVRTGSGFGMRFHPILHIFRMHEGQDFVCPKGSEVYATADGKVTSVRKSTTFGNVVEIDHGFGYLTLYAHLSGFNVKQGQKVKRGDIIGYVGSTGLSSGYHLHYEVHKNGKPINPISYFFNDLSPEKYVQMHMIADSIQQSMD